MDVKVDVYFAELPTWVQWKKDILLISEVTKMTHSTQQTYFDKPLHTSFVKFSLGSSQFLDTEIIATVQKNVGFNCVIAEIKLIHTILEHRVCMI